MAISAKLVKELREKTGAGMMDCKKALTATDGDLDKAADWLREKGIAKAAKKQSRIAAEGLCNVLVDGNEAVVFELNCETDFVAKNDNFKALLDEVGSTILNSKASNLDEALAVELNGKTLADVLVEATAKIGEKISLRRVARFTKEDSASFGAYAHMGGKIVSLTIIDGVDEEVAKDVSMHVAAINPKYLDPSQISEDVIEHEKQILTAEALNEGKPANIVEKMVQGRLNKYLKEICLVNQPFVKDPDQTVEKFVKANKGTIVGFTRLEVGEGIEKRQDDFASEVMSQVNA
ncbi:translation elongation factor Ts [Candidatus Xianfuyuplasma coldseepsis]|uniref:Elongation factor Ts n=1 Tax=Candidatus Xianfuyuplasma coldseepsis TaxID=2782163 RepID=A0A7L7KRW1_9MOLU|nr:translation elongation factor Ts [Xianfuyuplasma coldseepsis]QMS85447.1 elongation factor Ts [Xianfuyuplasma coldseepsis]